MFADSMWVGLLNQMSSSAPSFPNLPFPFFLDIYFAHFIQPFLFHLITNCQFHFCTAYGLICQDRYQCNLRPPLLSSPPPSLSSPPFRFPPSPLMSSFVPTSHCILLSARHCAARHVCLRINHNEDRFSKIEFSDF